jgi:uncharacterized integral membrane protein
MMVMMMMVVLLLLIIIIIIIMSNKLECEVILGYLVGLTAVVVPLQHILKSSV